MFSFYMPKYKTPEEIVQERKWRIASSGALNTNQALKWLEENPDIELDWFSVNDVYEELGMKKSEYNHGYGWLVPHGKKPGIHINGKLLEDYKKKQSELMKGIVIKDW